MSSKHRIESEDFIMVDFKSIQENVANMVGMKFGSYEASVKNMNNVYKKESSGANELNVFDTEENAISSKNTVYFQNGKHVATAVTNEQGNNINYSIWDNKMNRTYSTDWQNVNTASDKFNHIAFGGASVTDTNGNGIVDKDDVVTYYEDNKVSVTVKDLLGESFFKKQKTALKPEDGETNYYKRDCNNDWKPITKEEYEQTKK